MTEHPTPDDESPVVLDSLPAGGLSVGIVDTFNDRHVCQLPYPTSLTLRGSLVEGGACP